MLAIICVSALLCIVLGVKNVVWSRGKAWGVYGRQFLLRFSNHDQSTHIYLCLYFINNLFLDHAKSYKDFKQQREEKKTIKKLVQTFKVLTSITNK